MNWTNNKGGTVLIALGDEHYAQIDYRGDGTRWQAYVGRLVQHPDGYGPTKLEKWGAACEFEDLYHAKEWCQMRLDNAQTNVAEG